MKSNFVIIQNEIVDLSFVYKISELDISTKLPCNEYVAFMLHHLNGNKTRVNFDLNSSVVQDELLEDTMVRALKEKLDIDKEFRWLHNLLKEERDVVVNTLIIKITEYHESIVSYYSGLAPKQLPTFNLGL